MPNHRTRGVESAADRPEVAPRAGAFRTVALVMVMLEALALVAVAGRWLVEVVAAGSRNLAVGLFVAAFCLGVAAMLVVAARAVLRGRRGGRSPLVAWQLLQGATSVAVLQAAQGPVAAVAWVALGVATAALVALLTMMATGSEPASAAPLVR
ncbi:hypothetical protein [Cellulomonas sp. KRMCY2]|uniref:hypothetical protein n=1 Tax=Cellulomonas sp. KRMCY2 TaxID=1304865 RepID=UPI00045EC3D1|nr:hypothetical protein [Cellulomonas sp. KRMCY2]